MPHGRFAKRFPARLARTPGDEAFAAMALAPSYRAPDLSELHRGQPAPVAPPLAPEERRRLDAVIAAPDEDAPRLAFADYCDALRDLRGPYIRGQLPGQLLDPAAPVPGAVAARTREHFAPWGGEDFEWQRGFLAALSLAGRAFISGGPELLTLAPIDTVRLVAVQPYLAELAAAPHLARLRGLDLRGNRLGPAGVAVVLASPFLGNLRSLNVAGSDLTATDVAMLWSPALIALDLSENLLGPGVTWPARHFESLRLGNVGLGRGGAERLAASGLTARALDLGFNAITDDGLAAVMAAPLGRGCRRLGLRGNRLTGRAREILAGFAGAVDLRANFL